MDKGFWGPATWCMIHTAAVGYQIENNYSMRQFVSSLPFLLPCEKCRIHLQHNLKTIPLTQDSLSSNRKLFMWSYFLHDLVNKQLYKPSSPPYTNTEKYYFEHGINTKFWGPCFWRALHSFAAAYRPEQVVRQAFKQFVYSLIGVIPCKGCRDHFRKNLHQLPLTDDFLQNNNTLFLWTYLLHDLVNKQLNKVSPPFETIKQLYFDSKVCHSCRA